MISAIARVSLLCSVCVCRQRAHIPKAIMTTLERDPQQEELQQAMAKRAEEERLAAHERQYQVGRGAGAGGLGGWGLKAKRAEEERLAAHERQYQVGRGAGGWGPGAGGRGPGAGGRGAGDWGLRDRTRWD